MMTTNDEPSSIANELIAGDKMLDAAGEQQSLTSPNSTSDSHSGIINPIFDGHDENFADDNRPFRKNAVIRRNTRASNLPTIQSGVVLDSQPIEMSDEPEPIQVMNTRNRKITVEAVPHIDFYRHSYHSQSTSRPTLHELHEVQDPAPEENAIEKLIADENVESTGQKFGWIEGVLIRNMLSIWGVMLFLRISWVVAQAGIWQTLIIIGISTFITLVTALSMSAISTNGEIGGGGTYYVMSRILGPEFGGSIGIIFAIANAMDCSLNVVGFCQSVLDMMKEYGGYIIVDGGANDIRIIGTVTLVFISAICGLGAKYETKMKDVMLVVLLVALSNFIAGSIMGPENDTEASRGFIGYNITLLNENWNPGYISSSGRMQNFLSVFTVYFPAAIGILAGANVSGDLKNPNTAIPKGTILAIIICSFSYAVIAIICGATMTRAATGVVDDYINGTNLDCDTNECTYGLYYDYQAMTLISAYAPLNYVGCFAATISSALSDFVSCPALLQVIAYDKLYPYWMVGFLGKPYGVSKQPLRAYAFTFVLALAFVLIANLDNIALIISNFFLATFALMNFSTFHVSLIKPIGWRPTFKAYNMWLSLLVGILSIVGMFLISVVAAMVTITIVLFFYMVVLYRSPEVNWGSSTQAQTYRTALSSILQLVHIEEHVKNFRPQVLVMSGLPGTRPALVDFAYLICKNNSLMICGNIFKEPVSIKTRTQFQNKGYTYLKMNNIKGLVSVMGNVDLAQGVSAMLGLIGLGKMKPNILLMGYKGDWFDSSRHSLDQYFSAIHTGFDLNVGVAILRVRDGFDCTGILADVDDLINKFGEKKTPNGTLTEVIVMETGVGDAVVETESKPKGKKTRNKKKDKKKTKETLVLRDPAGNELPKSILNRVIMFQKKQRKDYVDVWWLSDDGGLTLLLPMIINNRSNWSESKLRIFCTASGVEELEKEQRGMTVLLSKFRIDYSDLFIITDANTPPRDKTKLWFDSLIRPFTQRAPVDSHHISETELKTYQYKTDRHLRLRELLLDHSSDSNLVVMTLPMPRKEAASAPLYMAWLETLTANMPPFLLVRGNQTSVLTFYS